MRLTRTRLALVTLALASACLREHDPAAVETRSDDCYTCHKLEYEAAGRNTLGTLDCQPDVRIHYMNPDPLVPDRPTTCGSCHGTTAWCPASEAHPETAFPIASGPHRRPCDSCHTVAGLPYTLGNNTSCSGCHMPDGKEPHSRAKMDEKHLGEDESQDYIDVRDGTRPGSRNFPFTDENFCLDCHPRGRN